MIKNNFRKMSTCDRNMQRVDFRQLISPMESLYDELKFSLKSKFKSLGNLEPIGRHFNRKQTVKNQS